MTHETVTATQIRDEVRDYIIGSFLTDDQGEALRNDDDLLTILNSLQLLRMVIEVESRYAIIIDDSELAPENLGTIENIAAFVTGKLDRAE